MASRKKSFIMFTVLVAAVTLSSSWSGMSLRVELDDGRHISQSSKNVATTTTTPGGGGGGLPQSKMRRIEGTTTEPIRANQYPPEDDDYVLDPIEEIGDPIPTVIITPEGKEKFTFRPDPPPPDSRGSGQGGSRSSRRGGRRGGRLLQD